MPPRTWKAATLRASVVPIVLLAVAACSSDGDKPDDKDSTKRPSASASPTGPKRATADPPLAFGPGKEIVTESVSDRLDVRDDTVYAVPARTLNAVDVATGTVRWSVPLEGTAPFGETSIRPRVFDAGGKPTVVVVYRVLVKGSGTTPDGEVVRVATFGTDGKPGWKIDVQASRLPRGTSPDRITAANTDHVVVVSGGERDGAVNLYGSFVLDARTGALRWLNKDFAGSTLDGDVVGGTDITSRTLAGRDARTGAPKWTSKFDPRASFYEAPGILIGDPSGGAPAVIDAGTGKALSALPTLGSTPSLCVNDGAKTIVCGAKADSLVKSSDYVIAFDAVTLKELWRIDEASGRLRPALTAARKGAVYAVTSKGSVILDARTGTDKVPTVTAAPQFVVPGYGVVSTDTGVMSYPATS